MEIREDKRGDVKIIGLCGKLDANSSPGVEKRLLAILDQGEVRIVFDFSELNYISSLGLRVLFVVAKRVQEEKGRLALASLSSHIYEIFKIVGFTNVFSIYPTSDEAVKQCTG